MICSQYLHWLIKQCDVLHWWRWVVIKQCDVLHRWRWQSRIWKTILSIPIQDNDKRIINKKHRLLYVWITFLWYIYRYKVTLMITFFFFNMKSEDVSVSVVWVSLSAVWIIWQLLVTQHGLSRELMQVVNFLKLIK